MDNTSSLAPYAYTLDRADRWEPPCWPTLEKAVAYLIKHTYDPASCRRDSPLLAHYADDRETERVNLEAFMEQGPVDETEVRVAFQKAFDDSVIAYKRAFPEGAEPRRRFSGEQYLCECRPEELEAMIQSEMARRSWRWKGAV